MYQIREIFFHERDEHGSIVSKVNKLSDEEKIRAHWRRQGLTEEQIEKKWVWFIKEQGHLWMLEQQNLPEEEINRRMKEWRVNNAQTF